MSKRKWSNAKIAAKLRDSARWLALHGMMTDRERSKVLRRIDKVYGPVTFKRAGEEHQ